MVWIGAVDCPRINKAEPLVKEWKLDPAACKFERSPATSSSRLTLVYGKELFSVYLRFEGDSDRISSSGDRGRRGYTEKI